MYFYLKALNLQLLRCFIEIVFHIVINLGRFMWQRLGKELGIEYESERWEGVQNPIEYLLKAYGEKEGSSIRGLIEATRRSGLKQCASQWKHIFDTSWAVM